MYSTFRPKLFIAGLSIFILSFNVSSAQIEKNSQSKNIYFENLKTSFSEKVSNVNDEIWKTYQSLKDDVGEVFSNISENSQSNTALVMENISEVTKNIFCKIKNIFGSQCENVKQDIINNNNINEPESPILIKTKVAEKEILIPSDTKIKTVSNNTNNEEYKYITFSGITRQDLEDRLNLLKNELPKNTVFSKQGGSSNSISSKQIDKIYDSINENIESAISDGNSNFIGQSLSVSGDISGANINLSGVITSTSFATSTFSGPIVATQFVGDGSLLTNLPFFDISTVDTDDLVEGINNKYYSQALFDASLASSTTDNLLEGSTNKYFTNQRAIDALTGQNISLFTNDSNYLSSISGLNISDLINDSGYLNSISGLNISDLNNDAGYISNLSTFDTDDLVQGSTNLYSQWGTNGSNVYYTGGNVGIGTTTPSTKMHLSQTALTNTREGFLRFSLSDAGNDTFQIGNGTSVDGRFISSFSGYIDSTNSRESMGMIGLVSAINDASNSSPAGIVNITAARTNNTSDPINGTLTSIVNRNLFSVAHNAVFTNEADFAMIVKPGGTVVFPSSGNVGVGTTSPTNKLSVSGSANISNNFIIGGNSPIGDDGFAGNSIFSITAPAVSSGRERLIHAKVSDSNNYFSVINTTSGNGVFIPTFVGYAPDSSSGQQAISFDGRISSINDTGTTPIITFRAQQLDGLTAVSNRPIAAFGSGANGNTFRTAIWSSGGLSHGSTYSATDPGTNNAIFQGSLGIGTTTPLAPLHVVGNVGSLDFIRIGSSATNQFSSIGFFDNNNSQVASFGYGGTTVSGGYANKLFFNANSRDFAWGNSGTINMTLTSGGNLGIGTVSPAGNLEVSGNNAQTIFATNYSNDTAGSGLFGRKARGTSSAPSATLSGDTLMGFGGSGYTGSVFSASKAAIFFDASQNWTTFNNGTQIRFSTTPNNSTTRLDRMIIDNAGNVGIGTSSPVTALSIYRAGTDLPSFRMEDGDISIPSYSSVGFNPALTTNTVGQFAALGSSIGGVQFQGFSNTSDERAMAFVGHSGKTSPTANPVVSFQAWKHDGVTNRTALTGSDVAFDFSSGSNSLVRILGGGNVGIGTTSPLYKLHVEGDMGTGGGKGVYIRNTNTTGYSELIFDNNTTPTGIGAFVFGYGGTGTVNPDQAYFWNRRNANILFGTNNTNRMVISGSGNVGIGTTTPSQILDIQQGTLGRMFFNGSYLSGSASGSSRLSIQNGSGSGSTAGSYMDLTGKLESWVTVEATNNASGFRVMRFGNATNGVFDVTNGTFAIQRVADNYGSISATPFQISNASPSNSFIINSSGNIGLGTISPDAPLHMRSSRATAVFESSGLTGSMPFTDVGSIGAWASTEFIGAINQSFQANGGLTFSGFTNAADRQAFTLQGHVGSTNPTAPAVVIEGWKSNGTTGRTAMTGSERIFSVTSGSGTSNFDVLANGNIGIGTTTPAGQLHVVSSGSNTPLVITKTSELNVRERLFTATVSDHANASFFINNGTINNNTFAPIFGGYTDSTTLWPLGFSGYVSSTNDASDSSAFGIVDIVGLRTTNASDPANGTLSDILNRKIFTVRTLNTNFLTLFPNGELLLNSPNTNNLENFLSVRSGDTTVSAGQTISSYRTLHSDSNAVSTELTSIRSISENEIISTATVNGSLAFFTTLNNTPTEALRMTSAGNIGIGTTNPRFLLEVGAISNALNSSFGTSMVAGISSNKNTFAIENTNTSSSVGGAFIGAYTNDGSAMASGDRTGGFFFGGFDGSAMRNASMIHAFAEENWTSSVSGSRIVFGTTAPGTNTRTDKFFFTGSGSLGIGESNPSAQLHTTGTVRFANFGAGTLTTDANGNVSVSSDERLKNISGDFSSGLDAVLGLNPILYKWNTKSGLETQTTYAGFSAQNVRDFIPEAVGESPNGFLSLNDRPILAVVVNAVKELAVKVSDLYEGVANIFVNDLKVKNQICIDDVCLDKEQLKNIIQNASEASVNSINQNNTENISSENTSQENEIEIPNPSTEIIIDDQNLNNLTEENLNNVVDEIQSEIPNESTIVEEAVIDESIPPVENIINN